MEWCVLLLENMFCIILPVGLMMLVYDGIQQRRTTLLHTEELPASRLFSLCRNSSLL